jgi:hypothetical protein
MIDTSDLRKRSSVRFLRRKVPFPDWFKNIQFRKGSTWGIAVCLGMAFFVGVAVLSPVFRLKTFIVERTSPFVDPLLVEQTLQDFHGKNMIFLNHADLRAVLTEKMPELRDIEITEDWPRSLMVKAGAAAPMYNVFNVETTNFSAISEDGIVLAPQSIEGLPVIKIHQRNKPEVLRDRIFTPEQLQQIHDAEGILDADLQLPIKSVEVLLAANELHLISRGDMAIWLDLSYSIEEQLDKLKTAEKKIQLYRDRFDHIDLRLPQQIFWEAL